MVELRTRTHYRHNEPPMSTGILGEDIDAKMAVAQSNKTGGRILKADADDPDRFPCIGFLYEAGLMGQEAEIVHFGLGLNLKKTGGNFDPGLPIYLSETAGYFSKALPGTGSIQIVGRARDASSAYIAALPPYETLSEGYSDVGNHTIEAGDGTDEITFAAEGDDDEFTVWHHGILYCVLDMTPLLADDPITVVGKMYHMIDGTNLRQVAMNYWNSTDDGNQMILAAPVTAGKTIQLSLQCSVAVGGDRAINHSFVMER